MDRRKARILALQALCQWDVQKSESATELGEFLDVQDASGAASEYAAKLVQMFWDQQTAVDEEIKNAAQHWSLERMSPVDRNMIRVAAVEIRNALVPLKVAVNEAIEIGNEFGGAESGRFINGVLDVLLKRGNPRPPEALPPSLSVRD